MREMT